MKTILQVMNDKELFAPWFKKRWLRGDSWATWRAFLATLYGLPHDEEIAHKHTHRAHTTEYREAFVVVGRRGGKSVVSALIAVYEACFKTYALAPGETGVVMLLAADRKQAQVLFRYVSAFFDVPILSKLVASRRKESIELDNGIAVEIHTSDYKSVRGRTLVCCICDELAFWRSETSANPDVEVLNAVRPGLATTNGLLLAISSPYARRGALWEAHQANYGKDGSEVLVWQASSRDMNPTLSLAVVAAAYVRDAASAAAEYGAQFRTDVEGFLSLEAITACVSSRRELPPLTGVVYQAFCDPSGGQSDSFTLAVAHWEKERAVLDLLREIPAPFSPEQAVATLAAELHRYRVHEIYGDRYAGEWPREQFEKRRISYRPSDKNRSELYLELLPLVMSGTVELLDHPKLIAQLVGLERRTRSGGRDSVDHSAGAHDDVANACAGALVLAAEAGGTGGTLAVFEFFKSGGLAARMMAAPRELARELGIIWSEAQAQKKSAANDEPVIDCAVPHEFGSSPLVVRLGAMLRCQQCGQTWFPGGRRPPISLYTRAPGGDPVMRRK